MSDKKHYAKRNHMAQGQYYLDHINAMTAEDLHNKSEIAGELAYRDEIIDELKGEINSLKEEVKYQYNEIKYLTHDVLAFREGEF